MTARSLARPERRARSCGRRGSGSGFSSKRTRFCGGLRRSRGRCGSGGCHRHRHWHGDGYFRQRHWLCHRHQVRTVVRQTPLGTLPPGLHRGLGQHCPGFSGLPHRHSGQRQGPRQCVAIGSVRLHRNIRHRKRRVGFRAPLFGRGAFLGNIHVSVGVCRQSHRQIRIWRGNAAGAWRLAGRWPLRRERLRLRLQALCRLGWRQRIFNQQDRRRSSGHRRGLDCHRPVRPCLRC